MKIKINNKEYNVKISDTEESNEIGLKNKKSLKENEGMLFVFNEEQDVSFWMKDTSIPLDIIFIDNDGDVIKVEKGNPNDETPITCKDVKLVLELNQNSGVSEDDEVYGIDNFLDEDIDNEEDDDNTIKMEVLNSDGSTQMELKGGERIFSRKNTERLMSLAKTANETKLKKDYKKLGSAIFKYIDNQDNQKQETVEIPI